MPKNHRTVWSEGMFLGPHHFQQHDRFLLNTLAAVQRGAPGYPFGFLELDIDTASLSEGKIVLNRAVGVFSDGTPFSFPDEDELPIPLEVDGEVRNQVVSLAIPRLDQDSKDIAEERQRGSFSRYLLKDTAVSDRHSLDSDSEETVFTAGLWARLVLEDSNDSAWHTLPIARIQERHDNGTVILARDFYPCALSTQASTPLQTQCRELLGLAQQRAHDIASKLGSPNASDTAQLTRFLLLQQINRATPMMQHWIHSERQHPEDLYIRLAQMVGEMSTLTTAGRVTPEFPEYLHRDQFASFDPVCRGLREALNWIPESSVESIPVMHVRAGIYTAAVTDLQLFSSARFILAARARVTPDELSRRLPRQTTISSKAQLRPLVEAQAQGIALQPMVTVPNSIPMYENYVYFELLQDNPLWQEMSVSGDIAMHIAGTYSDLQMQIWTVQK